MVQRIGYDSFTPDSGVLIAKNKDRESNSCGYRCFTWVIDAHPEDINRLDFIKPDRTRVMRTVADYRQLNDALFHAGMNSGSQYEWVDGPNRLHFYVVDLLEDARGILSYKVGVRSLDGAGPHVRGVFVSAPQSLAVSGSAAVMAVTVMNTGAAARVDPALHPQDTSPHVTSDIYRVSLTIEGEGWAADLPNALLALKPGESAKVPVHVTRTRAGAGRITVTIASESDPSKTASAATILSSR